MSDALLRSQRSNCVDGAVSSFVAGSICASAQSEEAADTKLQQKLDQLHVCCDNNWQKMNCPIDFLNQTWTRCDEELLDDYICPI